MEFDWQRSLRRWNQYKPAVMRDSSLPSKIKQQFVAAMVLAQSRDATVRDLKAVAALAPTVAVDMPMRIIFKRY